MSEKEQYILNWIKEVSVIRPELKNFAICPFASKSKFKIIECSIEELYTHNDYDVLIFIVEDYLNLSAIQFWINHYNSLYTEWKFFKDCRSYDTYINGIQTNNGKYNLILAQPSKKLRFFRQQLSKTSYYKQWNDDYLREILEDDYDLIETRDSNPVKSSDFNNQETKNDQTSR